MSIFSWLWSYEAMKYIMLTVIKCVGGGCGKYKFAYFFCSFWQGVHRKSINH